MRKKQRVFLLLILMGGILLSAISGGLLLLFPTNDYMKQTFSEKINGGFSSNIVVNGDSIGGQYGVGEWCTLLEKHIEDETNSYIEVTNISKPGNSSFAGIVSWEMLDPTDKMFSDLVILCYGQNDADDESFAVNYEALIRNTIAGNPNAEIIAILESSQRDYTNKINTIIKLCNYYKIPYVDTIKAFNESGYSYEELSDDGIHPNAKGKEIYADTIYEVIQSELLVKQHILDFKGERPAKKNAKNPEADQYLECKYIPIEDMEVKGNTIMVNIPPCKIIGFDRVFFDGKHNIILKIKEENYDVGYNWGYSFEQRHIDKLVTGNFDEGNVNIVFEDVETLERFKGLVCFQ